MFYKDRYFTKLVYTGGSARVYVGYRGKQQTMCCSNVSAILL